MHEELKTNIGMPPQSRSLEGRAADKPQGTVRNAPGREAVVRHSRDETAGNAKPVASPAQAERGVSRTFVLAKDGRPIMPCPPARARKLLAKGRARVVRMYPFTIRLIGRTRQESETQPIEVKFDPGASATGLAVVRAEGTVKHVMHLAAAAAVNATRNNIFFRLLGLGLSVEASTGGRTKFNRSRLGVPKAHCLDAACTGEMGVLVGWCQPVLLVAAMGRGSYQRTRVTKDGFPRGFLMRTKAVQGFQSGDLVRAVVPKGKKAGVHVGRVAVRQTGSFNIQTKDGTLQGIGWKHCRLVQRGNGYRYSLASLLPLPEGRGFREEER